MSAQNDFLAQRVERANFTVIGPNNTQNLTSGVVLPAGAWVTGVTINPSGAQTSASNATQSFSMGATNVTLISSAILSAQVSQTVPKVQTLSVAGGMYIPSSAEVIMSVASLNSTYTITPQVYIGYVQLT